MIKLLDGQTTNTDGTEDELVIKSNNFPKNYGTAVVYGTFDTCTVTLEFSPDSGTTWITVGDDTTFTENGGGNFYINSVVILRFTLTSAGGSTSITAGII